MQVSRRDLLQGTLAIAVPLGQARAQGVAKTIRIGVMNDLSGNYRDGDGPTSVACARQAVEDFGAQGFRVEVLVGDHQNKPDVGAAIVRQWFDREGVDAVADVNNSAVALAVNTIAKDRNKAYLNTGAGTNDLTGKHCTPVTIHWSYDIAMLATSTGSAMVRTGGDTWFFITADYVFGHQLQQQTTAVVTKLGGKVLGSRTYPFPDTTDFSSLLVQAKESKAKVVGLANAGNDTVNCIKQAREFGLARGGTRLAALLGGIQVAHGVGLETAQGLLNTESFYWDLNDRTRAFTKRVLPKTPTNYPNTNQAGCYAATLHYLKSVAAIGVDRARDGAVVVAHMKSVPADDDAFGTTTIRADGRAMVTPYLFEVKTPAESRGEWDLYKVLQSTPADEAAPPVSDCPLVRT
jgi:branched-chain amino acid transport system substrate-binding protein